MTFLELCQRVAQESGTVSGAASPPTVISQTGRLAKIVNWTASAWEDIQRERKDWQFLRLEGTAETVSGIDAYDLPANGADWIVNTDHSGWSGISAYRTADGVGGESYLRWLPWADWRDRFTIGTQTNAAPDFVTISPQRQLRLGPKPDGAYTLRYEYRRKPQVFALDADEPIIPDEYHMLIVWTALIYLGTDDEATTQLPLWERRRQKMMFDLLRDQTPGLTLAPPFA